MKAKANTTKGAPAPNQPPHLCDNCGWRGDTPDEIRNLWERVDTGGIMPSGQCPHCGALCYLDTPAQRLHAAAPALLQACRDALEIMQIAKAYFPQSIRNSARFRLLNIEANSIRPAIAQATGTN
jgi:hypothetical protein